jgi:hypothetical protein
MCDEQSGFYKQRIPLSGASQTYPRTVSGSLSVGDIHGLFASPPRGEMPYAERLYGAPDP